MPPDIPGKIFRIQDTKFSEWTSLNDSIMGGNSQATCSLTSNGLLLKGTLIEQGGGFVSCTSPIFSPPLDLSPYRGLQLDVEGKGRTLKFGISCNKTSYGLQRFISGDIRWIASVPTDQSGVTTIKVPFNSLKPAIRAKPVLLPIKFDSSCISRLQLLHSKFGQPGEMNPGFQAGAIEILLRSINAYF